MITDDDIKKLKKVFVTKNELKKELKRFATKDDLADSVRELREEIINFKDSILSEIIKLREDVTVIIGYRDLIENHDKRIGKLETTVYR